MHNLSGITQSGLSKTIPDSVRPSLNGALEALFSKGVTRGASDAGLPTFNTYGHIDDAKLAVRTALKDIVGQSGKRADKEIGKIGDAALARTVANRFDNLNGAEKKELKSQLHYAFGKRVGTAEDRLINRSAIMSAFAQGASLADTKLLRTFLDGATSANRQAVLDALKLPGANATAVINQFAGTGPAGDPADVATARGGPMTSTEVAKLHRHLEVTDFNASVFAPAIPDDDSPGIAHQFVQGHLEDLGLDSLDSQEARSAVAEFAAISVYTGSEGFQELNRELRACGGKVDELAEGPKLFAAAAAKGLARLPDFEGVVVRGVDSANLPDLRAFLDRYQPDATVTEHAFTSAGAEKPFGGDVQFIIESRHGKEITNLSQKAGMDGREVLFPPNTRFQVLDHAEGKNDKGKDVHYIVMKEVG